MSMSSSVRDLYAELSGERKKRLAAEIARDKYRAAVIDLEAALMMARRRILELEDEGVTIRRQRGW